jgi:hypothetical protein
MVVGTLGLLLIAYKASSVSIEIANTKIELLAAVSQTKEIRDNLEAESQRLASANKLFQENIDTLAKSAKASPSALHIEELTKGLRQPTLAARHPDYKKEFDALDAKIKSAEETLRK